MPQEKEIIKAIRTIFDPEISVNIYDLGLIRRINVRDDEEVDIVMTLTSPNCPFAQQIPVDVRKKVLQLDDVADVTVEIEWDPPWTMEQMSEVAKLELELI